MIAGTLLPTQEKDEIAADALIASGMLAIGEWGIGDSNAEKMHSLEARGLGAISSGVLDELRTGKSADLQKDAEQLRGHGAVVKTELLTGSLTINVVNA